MQEGKTHTCKLGIIRQQDLFSFTANVNLTGGMKKYTFHGERDEG